jgi:hypothetical protein
MYAYADRLNAKLALHRTNAMKHRNLVHLHQFAKDSFLALSQFDYLFRHVLPLSLTYPGARITVGCGAVTVIHR